MGGQLWTRATGLVQPYMLTDPPSLTDIWERAKASGDEAVLERFLTSSLVDLAADYFEDERVRAMMLYVQDIADPYAPGSAWAEVFFQFGAAGGHGYYVVEGGMGSITRYMAEAVEEQGGEIRCDAPVAQVLVENGKATGVRLESGEEFRTDLVVSNADPKRTYRTLFSADDLPGDLAKRVERLKSSTGYFKFHCVMDETPDVSGYLPDYDAPAGLLHHDRAQPRVTMRGLEPRCALASQAASRSVTFRYRRSTTAL